MPEGDKIQAEGKCEGVGKALKKPSGGWQGHRFKSREAFGVRRIPPLSF